LSTPCSELKTDNFTITTQYESGKTFHIDSRYLLADMADNSCALTFTVLVGDEYKASGDRLLLGHAFLNAYNVSMRYESNQIGFTGYMTDAPVNPADKNNTLIIILIVVGVILIGGVIGYYIIKKRRVNLEKKLETMGEQKEALM
jgi:hypothetical protein